MIFSFCVCFVKVNGGLILDVYKGVSLIGGNCTKTPKKLIINPPKS